MHDADRVGQVGEAGRDAVRAHLGPTKYDDTLVLGFLEQGKEELVLLVGGDGVEGVTDGFGGGTAEADLDGDGVTQHPGGQSFNLRRYGGGEKQGLPFGRAETDDFFDVRKEAHVQHPVHFVEDQVGEMGQVDFALIHEIKEPAGGRHHDVDAALDLFTLATIAHPPVDQADLEAGVLGELSQGLSDLVRQLPRRLQDEGAEPARFFQMLEDGKGEGGGFAGAGLGGADQILSGQGNRDGLGLNRGGLLVA